MKVRDQSHRLFRYGTTMLTADARDALSREGLLFMKPLRRHIEGDWGDVSDADKAANDEAVKNGGPIRSSYILPKTGARLAIVTEADRKTTTMLLPLGGR